jgi:hypothetical protein
MSTTTTTELETLEEEKEKIWTGLLKAPWDSKESNDLGMKYVSICRKIRRLKDEHSR